jgi:hypothetical protein
LSKIGRFLTTPLVRPAKSSWQVYAERNPQVAASVDPSKPNVLKQMMDAVDEIAIGMTAPLSIATMAGVAALPKQLGKLAGVGFGIPMIAHGIEAFENDNLPKGIINTTLGLLAVAPGTIAGVKKLQGAATETFGSRGLMEEGGFLNIESELPPKWKAYGDLLKEYWGSVTEPGKTVGRRIGRLEKRKPDVGKHANTRHYLYDGTGQFPVGPQSAKDMVALVRGYGSDAEIQEAALFYDKLAPVFQRYMGEEDAPSRLLAWLLSQLNTGPSKGMGDMLAAERIAGGLKEISGGGLNESAILSTLEGRAPAASIGQKLSDFIDAGFGKATRTIMGNEPKYGGPVPVDVHMMRLAGYVDEAYYNFLTEKFGPKRLKGIKLDRKVASPSEAIYERVSQFINEITPEFRKQKVGGIDSWTPSQVQAALWAAFRKKLDLPYAAPELLFTQNASTVPFEVAFGTGSPFSKMFPDLYELPYEKNAAITDYVGDRVVDLVAADSGIRIIGRSLPFGAYKEFVNPNKSVEALGTPQAVAEFESALGYLLNQTDMIAYRIKSRIGKPGRAAMTEAQARAGVTRVPKEKLEGELEPTTLHSGIDIVLPDRFKDRGAFTQFYDRMRTLDPSIDGASAVMVGGKPAIRIIEPSVDNPVWSTARYRQVEATIDQIANELKLDPASFTTDWFGAQVQRSHNNWTEDITGNGHLKRLDQAGRSTYSRQLVDTYRPKVEQWIREGFEQFAPKEWRAWQQKGGGGGSQGGSAPQAARAAREVTHESARISRLKASQFNETKLGEKVPLESLGKSPSIWLSPSGDFIKSKSGRTHGHAMNVALGIKRPLMEMPIIPVDRIKDTGYIRMMLNSTEDRIFLEAFSEPTDAQLRSLRALEKHKGLRVEWDLVGENPVGSGEYGSLESGIGLSDLSRAVQSNSDALSLGKVHESSTFRPGRPLKIKPSKLGTPLSSPERLSRGWLAPDGTAIQVKSHESSLANALNIPEEQAFYSYPELANQHGLVRVLMRRNPETVIVELFDNPTDAQLRSLLKLEKAHWRPVRFYFSDPITQRTRGVGEGVNQIRRTLHEIEAEEAINPPDRTTNVSTRRYAPNPQSTLLE